VISSVSGSGAGAAAVSSTESFACSVVSACSVFVS
jgi:hypothetical protein